MSPTKWTDEESVIDAFVESIHKGDASTVRRAGKRLVKKYFDGDWDKWVSVCDGTLLRPEDIPLSPEDRVDGVSGVEALEGQVSPERLSELEDEASEGESLTPHELEMWRLVAAEDILTENPDCDVYPLWAVVRYTHSDGRVAFLADLGGGYSFTGPWKQFVCGATTEQSALGDLRTLGFTDVEDFRARWRPKSS